MVGTDLAGGNDRCSLDVVVEGTVTVITGIIIVISGTVTVDMGLDSVEARESLESDRIVDTREGIALEDDGVMLDDGERELVENGGCWGAALTVPVGTGGWAAGLETDGVDSDEVRPEVN